jgi:hypothetical protein
MGKNLTAGSFDSGFPKDIALHLAPQCEYMRGQNKSAVTEELPGAGHLTDRRAIGASPDPTLPRTFVYDNPCSGT